MDYLLDLPLGVKIYVKPKSKLVLCRGKLGEKLYGLSPSFNLDDPYMHHLDLQYNCLYDPHLQDYHKRKDILRMLKKQGCVTRENKVICTVKEFNEYRQYLTRIKMELEQMLREEKSKDIARKSRRFRRGKGALNKGETNSTAELGQEDASRAADSQQKPDNTADSLFKAVLEQLTTAEALKLQGLVETVVHEVFGRLRVPRDHYVNFLRRAARRIRGIVFGGCVKTETPLDHHQEIELVAKELIATALEILGDYLETKASEPGRAARQKEQPVDGGASQSDTSKEAETGRARLHACLDELTTQVVKNVRCLLKSLIASQFGEDYTCEYTEILKLPKGRVSYRQMEPSISGSSKEQSKEESTGVKLPALGPQLHAEGTGYAKTMEPEDSAMVKESSVREASPATSGNTLDIRTIANRIVQSLLDHIGQHGPAPTARQNFQGPVPSPATSQGGEESSAAEDSLPSVDPQFSRQPTPPEGPKPPAQARQNFQGPVPSPATSQGGEESSAAEDNLPSVDPQFSRQPTPPEGPKPPVQARQNFQGPVPSSATSQGGEESSAAEDSLPSVDPQFSRQPTPPEGPKPPAQARQNFQGPVPSPATSQGGEESSAAEDSLPSVDPQFSRQPTPPEGPKPPAQAGARRRSVHMKFAGGE